jgi:hypothetical protein
MKRPSPLLPEADLSKGFPDDRRIDRRLQQMSSRHQEIFELVNVVLDACLDVHVLSSCLLEISRQCLVNSLETSPEPGQVLWRVCEYAERFGTSLELE